MAAVGAAPPQGSATNASTSDTLAALLLLASQFPAAARAAGLPPIMLKAQVYTIVADRTAVDRDLEQLRWDSIAECGASMPWLVDTSYAARRHVCVRRAPPSLQKYATHAAPNYSVLPAIRTDNSCSVLP